MSLDVFMQHLLSISCPSSPRSQSSDGKVLIDIVTDNAKVPSKTRQYFRKRSLPDILRGDQRWFEQAEPVAKRSLPEVLRGDQRWSEQAEPVAEPGPVPKPSRPGRKNALDISDHSKKESRWESIMSRVDPLDQPRTPSRKVEINAPPVDLLLPTTVAEKRNDYTMQRSRSMVSTEIICPHLEAASPEMIKGLLSQTQSLKQVQRALDICNSW
jgi:hypothetical protein